MTPMLLYTFVHDFSHNVQDQTVPTVYVMTPLLPPSRRTSPVSLLAHSVQSFAVQVVHLKQH